MEEGTQVEEAPATPSIEGVSDKQISFGEAQRSKKLAEIYTSISSARRPASRRGLTPQQVAKLEASVDCLASAAEFLRLKAVDAKSWIELSAKDLVQLAQEAQREEER